MTSSESVAITTRSETQEPREPPLTIHCSMGLPAMLRSTLRGRRVATQDARGSLPRVRIGVRIGDVNGGYSFDAGLVAFFCQLTVFLHQRRRAGYASHSIFLSLEACLMHLALAVCFCRT